MANNLFVSYDLDAPGQNYPKVTAAIEALGSAVKVHFSLYYVKSNLTPKQAAEHVWKSMDANDRLIVVDATNNNAHWFNAMGNSGQFMQGQWTR